MNRPAVITTAEVSRGAHAFADALTRFGYTPVFRTLLEESSNPSPADVLHIDRSLPPYDLPMRDWGPLDSWWNHPTHAWAAWDKALTSHNLTLHGLPIVPTVAFDYLTDEDPEAGYVSSAVRAQQVAEWSGFPAVVKPLRRSVGEGIVKVDDLAALRYEMAVLRSGVVQPFLPEGQRTLRVVVAAGTVIAAYERIAPEGCWKANVGSGASVAPVPVSENLDRMCVSALAALELDFAGVDVIESDEHGLLLLEVNPAFGVAGLLNVTDGAGVEWIIEALLSASGRTP